MTAGLWIDLMVSCRGRQTTPWCSSSQCPGWSPAAYKDEAVTAVSVLQEVFLVCNNMKYCFFFQTWFKEKSNTQQCMNCLLLFWGESELILDSAKPSTSTWLTKHQKTIVSLVSFSCFFFFFTCMGRYLISNDFPPNYIICHHRET